MGGSSPNQTQIHSAFQHHRQKQIRLLVGYTSETSYGSNQTAPEYPGTNLVSSSLTLQLSIPVEIHIILNRLLTQFKYQKIQEILYPFSIYPKRFLPVQLRINLLYKKYLPSHF